MGTWPDSINRLGFYTIPVTQLLKQQDSMMLHIISTKKTLVNYRMKIYRRNQETSINPNEEWRYMKEKEKWADPERIYTAKSILGFKRNPKESIWATNIRCALLSQLSLSIFHELLVEWVFFSNVQVRDLEDSLLLFFFYTFSTITSVCGFHSRIQSLKAKLVIPWSGVRGLWKKGSESPKRRTKMKD